MKWTLRLLLLAAPAPTLCSAELFVSMLVTHEICGYSNGEVFANVTGGVPPYTYQWSNGSTSEWITNLANGTYFLTVTDSNSEQVMAQADVASIPYVIQMYQPWAYCDAPGQLFPGDYMPPAGAVEPWYINGVPMEPAPGSAPGNFVFYPTGSVSYTYDFADGNGCTGTIYGVIGEQTTIWPTLSITNIEPSCSNQSTGSVSYQSTGNVADAYIQLVNGNGTTIDQGSVNGNLVGTIGSLPPGDYGISWWLGATNELLGGPCDHDTLWFTVPNLGAACGTVSGTSWYDSNGDCLRDVDEVGIPYSPLLLQPGGAVLLTNGQGTFDYPLLNGSYTLEQTDPTFIPICPASQPVAFAVNTDDTVIDFANGSTAPLDLGVSIVSGQSRPGFNVSISALARNLSPQVSGAVTVTMTLDPVLTDLSATPAPTMVAGNTVTWEFPAFSSFHSETVHVLANVPVGTPLGTILSHTTSVSNTDPEPDLTNNTGNIPVVVVGSYDPNDKTALTSTRGSAASYYIDQDTYIDYVIRFQNTGTAEAITVVVTDTMSADLDMLSFEQGVASHPFDVSFKPNRVVEWRFDNINLPDSNSNEAASHGSVTFRIKPHEPILPGTIIENIANIYFDYNDPIITEPSVLVAEFSTGVNEQNAESELVLMPNPANSSVMIQLPARTIQQVNLIAMDGRVAAQFNRPGEPIELDLSALSTGCYLVEVRDENKALHRSKLMITR